MILYIKMNWNTFKYLKNIKIIYVNWIELQMTITSRALFAGLQLSKQEQIYAS